MGVPYRQPPGFTATGLYMGKPWPPHSKPKQSKREMVVSDLLTEINYLREENLELEKKLKAAQVEVKAANLFTAVAWGITGVIIFMVAYILSKG